MRQVRVLDVLIFATLMTLSTPILVWAHGTAGKRFFPTTLTIDLTFRTPTVEGNRIFSDGLFA
jgi:hypothetical protein